MSSLQHRRLVCRVAAPFLRAPSYFKVRSSCRCLVCAESSRRRSRVSISDSRKTVDSDPGPASRIDSSGVE